MKYFFLQVFFDNPYTGLRQTGTVVTNDPWEREIQARVQVTKPDGEKEVRILTIPHEYLRVKGLTGIIVERESDLRKRKIKHEERLTITKVPCKRQVVVTQATPAPESAPAEVAWWSHFAECKFLENVTGHGNEGSYTAAVDLFPGRGILTERKPWFLPQIFSIKFSFIKYF